MGTKARDALASERNLPAKTAADDNEAHWDTDDDSVAHPEPIAIGQRRLPMIPVAFLGIGFYRAWIEIAFVGSFVSFPAVPALAREWFDGAGVIVMILCVLLARRIGPFYRHPSLFILCGACMTLSTIALFATMLVPGLGSDVVMAAAVVGGVGLGLIILIWSEVFGCLSPLRVTLYYSASIALGAVLVYIFMGFRLEWLACFTALLPTVSLAMARRSMARVPEKRRPQPSQINFRPPWKIFLLMALYGFAYGILETRAYTGLFGPHSSPGVLVVALVIFFSVALRREKFDFNSIVRIALPLTVVALWLVPMLGLEATVLSGPCAIGGYTAARSSSWPCARTCAIAMVCRPSGCSASSARCASDSCSWAAARPSWASTPT